MKTISQIRKELDEMNATVFTQKSADELWILEEAWSRYKGQALGQMRLVIEDRLDLAHSRRVSAGFITE